MRLKQVDMVNVNLLRTITSGVLCAGTENIVLRETEELTHCIISPEKHSITQFYFSAGVKTFMLEVNFHEPHAHLDIFGLYQLNEKQKMTINTQVNHFAPQCKSQQTWRGILQGESQAAFTGKIIVHPKAQKTTAHLSNKNLLLSSLADVITKPELEIYADDVQCSHGATVGCLDKNALFYLRARGIDEFVAREMLVEAFVAEARVIRTDGSGSASDRVNYV